MQGGCRNPVFVAPLDCSVLTLAFLPVSRVSCTPFSVLSLLRFGNATVEARAGSSSSVRLVPAPMHRWHHRVWQPDYSSLLPVGLKRTSSRELQEVGPVAAANRPVWSYNRYFTAFAPPSPFR